MENDVLRALEGSIEKWRKIAFEGKKDQGRMDCPLCDKFWDRNVCGGCPISDKGYHHCSNPEYNIWVTRSHKMTISDHCHCRICRKIAENEYNFLRSLLPEGYVEKNVPITEMLRRKVVAFLVQFL